MDALSSCAQRPASRAGRQAALDPAVGASVDAGVNSRIAVLDGQRHFAMWDDPDLVARALLNFLLSEDPPSPKTP